jgi:hypothetical protein
MLLLFAGQIRKKLHAAGRKEEYRGPCISAGQLNLCEQAHCVLKKLAVLGSARATKFTPGWPPSCIGARYGSRCPLPRPFFWLLLDRERLWLSGWSRAVTLASRSDQGLGQNGNGHLEAGDRIRCRPTGCANHPDRDEGSVAPPGFLHIPREALNTNSENLTGAGRLWTTG